MPTTGTTHRWKPKLNCIGRCGYVFILRRKGCQQGVTFGMADCLADSAISMPEPALASAGRPLEHDELLSVFHKPGSMSTGLRAFHLEKYERPAHRFCVAMILLRLNRSLPLLLSLDLSLVDGSSYI